jgi:hypothetical protein
VRVIAIDPGMVETEFSKVRFGDDTRAKAAYEGITPLSPDDIGMFCFYFSFPFLCSPFFALVLMCAFFGFFFYQ